MAKFSKEVKQVFGFLGEDQDYSKKQLTLTSWGVYAPKFDIRKKNKKVLEKSSTFYFLA